MLDSSMKLIHGGLDLEAENNLGTGGKRAEIFFCARLHDFTA